MPPPIAAEGQSVPVARVQPTSQPLPSPTLNPPTATPLLTNQGLGNLQIYYVPRRFEAESKLHRYLARKCPTLIFPRRFDYNLYEVLTALKRVIASEKLFDRHNPTVVICNDELEDALNVNALHVSEIRQQVCMQFHPIIQNVSENLTNAQHQQYSEGQTTSNLVSTQTSSNIQGSNIQHPNALSFSGNGNISSPNQIPNMNPTQTLSNNLSTNQSGQIRTAAVSVNSNTANVAVGRVPIAPEPIILPSWASNTANAVIARRNSTNPFDIEGRYLVKPAFLKVLRAVEGVNQSQVVFPYREVANLLSKYIMMNKDKFFDLRNIRVAIVKNDPLGVAFGVNAFARCQVTALMRSQLMPFTGVEPIESLPEPRVEPKHEPEKRKRNEDVSDSSTDDEGASSSRRLSRNNHNSVKRKRRNSRNISNAMSESSGDETIYSAQGYETAAICDNSDDNSSESLSDNQTQNDVYNEENTYRVEYEIDSGNDNDKDDSKNGRAAESDENSEIEDVLISSAVSEMLNELSNLSEWADLESNTDDEFALSANDTERLDSYNIYKCINCGQPNAPHMRYCRRCWEDRKSWVPERANPRRRKKTKTLENLSNKTGKHDKLPMIGLKQKNTSKLTALVITHDTPSISSTSSRLSFASTNQSLICTLCCARPKDACFVHGQISHQVCCYQCAKTIFRNKGNCPICRRRIEKITKNIMI